MTWSFVALWVCLTPIVWLVGGAMMLDKEKQDHVRSAGVSALLVLPLWWALFFALRLLWELAR